MVRIKHLMVILVCSLYIQVKGQEFVAFSTSYSCFREAPHFPVTIYTDTSKLEIIKEWNSVFDRMEDFYHKRQYFRIDKYSYEVLFNFLIAHDEQISPCYDHKPMRIYYPEIFSEARRATHITNDFGKDKEKTFHFFSEMKVHMEHEKCSLELTNILNTLLEIIQSDYQF